VRKAANLPPSCAVVTKSGNLNFLEPSGPVQACNGTALPSFAGVNCMVSVIVEIPYLFCFSHFATYIVNRISLVMAGTRLLYQFCCDLAHAL